jgi:hypothetical protein
VLLALVVAVASAREDGARVQSVSAFQEGVMEGLKTISILVTRWAAERGILPSPGTKITSIRPPGETAYLVCYGGERRRTGPESVSEHRRA